MTEASKLAERRLVLRLLEYWRQIAGHRPMPSAADIVPESIPDMWPNCFVLRVVAGGEPVYERIGSAYAPELAGNLIGVAVGGTPLETSLRQAARYWGLVADRKVPISLAGEFRHLGGDLLLYRSIILPLSEDGERIDHMLGAANWRSVVAE